MTEALPSYSPADAEVLAWEIVNRLWSGTTADLDDEWAAEASRYLAVAHARLQGRLTPLDIDRALTEARRPGTRDRRRFLGCLPRRALYSFL